MLLISSEAVLYKKAYIMEQDLACLDCEEKKYARDGRHRGKHEKRQRYK